jgi:hypothetical protein
MQIITLEMEGMKLKKQLIQEYAGSPSTLAKIITKEARDAIKQSQEEIQVLATLK